MSGPLSLVYPVMAQVLFTFVVMLWAGRVRFRAAAAGRVRLADIALSNDAWPDDVRKVANNMNNQFETPLLFYVLCGVATTIGATGTVMAALAWVYVVSRLVHTAIHVTGNRVRHRFAAFALGMAALIVMWALIALRLLAAG